MRLTTLFMPLIAALALAPGCQAIATLEGEIAEDPASTGDENGGASLSPFLVNGSVDHGHPSVGLLQSSMGNCTATLVGSRTVLTAAHCIGNNNRFTVGGRRYSGSHVAVHPRCKLNIQHPYCTYTNRVENDIGLVVLSKPVSNVTPSPIATRSPWVGQQLVLVGFGKTSESGGAGTKRMGPNRIAALSSTKIRFDPIAGSSNLCNGDSGGPSFGQGSTGEEVVVGVHSTKNGVCGNGGHDMRVERYRNWLVASASGDIRLEGQAAPSDPSNPDPPPTPSTGNAGEGDSCMTQGCKSGLACTGFQKQDGSSLGRFCLERCSNIGGSDPACDGDEACTSSANGGICFASNRPQTGYAHIETDSGGGGGGGTPPPATATEGQSCKHRGCVAGLHCTTVHTFFATYKYCMEACSGVGDPACDGGEVCSRSPENKLVCFLSTAPQTGFTNPGNGGSGGGGGGGSGGGGFGTCTSGGVVGTCQSIEQSCSGSYVSGLCPGDNTIKCCLPPSGGGGSTPPPSSSCGNTKETAAFKALNAARVQSGKSPLSCDTKALAAARAHSQDMCAHNFASHTGSDGSSLSTRLHRAGASFSSASQSVAKGFSSGTSVINGWMKSSGNQQILLGSSWKRAAIGVASCSGGNRWTAVVVR